MRENFTLIEVTLMYKMDVSINWAKAIWNETIAINEEIYKKLSNFWQNEENDNLKKKKVYWREKKYVHNFANLYGGASVMERSAKISNVDNILQDS